MAEERFDSVLPQTDRYNIHDEIERRGNPPPPTKVPEPKPDTKE